MRFSIPLVSSLLSTAVANELALYWGQASAGSQKSLADYCQNSAGDIYLISFVTTFGSGRDIAMNIAGYNNFIAGTNLLDAPELGQEIKTCQSLGKKVFVSLGGAIGSYGFNSNSDAEKVATDLWNLFGGGSSQTRPFGDARIDGFDLDIENNLAPEYYVPFINKLRELYGTDSSKQYYTSAAPQCPFPDASSGQAIAKADLDYIFIQFYNNYCSLSGNNFNFDTWQSFASTSSPNKNVKLLVGLPGSPTAAGSGYLPIDQIKAKRSEFENSPNFGGYMVWDASQADQNKVGGSTFGEQLKELAGGSPAKPSSSVVTSAPKSTTSSAPAAPQVTSSSVPAAAPQVTSSSIPAAAPQVTSSSVPAAAPQVTTSPAASPNAAASASQETTPAVPAANTDKVFSPIQSIEPVTTVHTTSTINSVIAKTNTITSAPPSAAATSASSQDCIYTTNNEVVVVETRWTTQYTTVWV